jgi:hypothetical protein
VCCIGLEEEDILGHLTLTSPSGRATSNSTSETGSVSSYFFFLIRLISIRLQIMCDNNSIYLSIF